MKSKAATILDSAMTGAVHTRQYIRDYRIVSEFKSTVSGRVLLGIYFKDLWFKRCIIKEVYLNHKRAAENENRRNRLLWQFRLHQRLSLVLPVPRPLEIIEIDRHVYLILDFIKGTNLQNAVDKLYGRRSYRDLSGKSKKCLLGWLTDAALLIEKLHKLGYLHRDISASNFIVSKSGALYLLDLEVAWAMSGEKRDGCFNGWTEGYSSPQQVRNEQPSEKDDVFSVGALMFNVLTHVHPKNIDLDKRDTVVHTLSGLIEYADFMDLIVRCLDPDPSKRPSIESVIHGLRSYQIVK